MPVHLHLSRASSTRRSSSRGSSDGAASTSASSTGASSDGRPSDGASSTGASSDGGSSTGGSSTGGSSTGGSSSRRSPSTASFLLLVAAGLLWGGGGVTGRALADASGLAGPAIAAYRLGVGGGLLVLLLVFTRRPVPRSRAAWTRIGAAAALAAAFQCSYFAAIALGTVSIATLITIGSAPLFVAGAQAVASRSWPTVRELRPVMLGVFGLAVLVGAPAASGSVASTLACAGLAATSGAAFAAFTLLGRRPLFDGDEATVTGYAFLLGGLVLAACTMPFTALTFAATPRSIALLALLAAVPTALAYTLFFRGLRSSTAGTATVVALLEPLTATVLAVLLLGDSLTTTGVVGAALLLLSVLDAGRAQIGLAETGPAEIGPANNGSAESGPAHIGTTGGA